MLRKNKLWLGLMSSVLALVSTSALAQWELNMPEGITGISRDTYSLHMIIFGICVLIGIVVMFVLSKPKKGTLLIPAPGYYHVLGVDRTTGERRETTFHAQTREAANGRAEMEGIVVTEIRQVNESL